MIDRLTEKRMHDLFRRSGSNYDIDSIPDGFQALIDDHFIRLPNRM